MDEQNIKGGNVKKRGSNIKGGSDHSSHYGFSNILILKGLFCSLKVKESGNVLEQFEHRFIILGTCTLGAQIKDLHTYVWKKKSFVNHD